MSAIYRLTSWSLDLRLSAALGPGGLPLLPPLRGKNPLVEGRRGGVLEVESWVLLSSDMFSVLLNPLWDMPVYIYENNIQSNFNLFNILLEYEHFRQNLQ